jgi:nucleoid DNA-binding protein
MTIGRKEIRTSLARMIGFTESKTHELLTVLEESAFNALLDGHKILICNLGTIRIKEHAARTFKSPTTGVVHHLPAKKYIAFVPSEKVIKRINLPIEKAKFKESNSKFKPI